MDNSTKIEKMTFEDYYKSLGENEKKTIRDGFLEASGLSYPSFYSKLTRGGFTKLEIGALEYLCGRQFFI